MNDWISNQYTKFEKERTQPSTDLISRIDIYPKTAVDIGCGPGNSTNRLYKRFSNADILGIDSSDNMLLKAKNDYPKMNFRKCTLPGDLESLGSYDLIFSNACLHWIPDHKTLLPKLMAKLNEGGVLAAQLPLVQYAEFYKILNKLILKDKWSKLRDIHLFHNLSPNETYDILAAVSSGVTMWETVYYHVLPACNSVIDWYKGSGLRPYIERLTDCEQSDFTYELTEMLKDAFPTQSDGKVILKMPRLFFIAAK